MSDRALDLPATASESTLSRGVTVARFIPTKAAIARRYAI